MFIPIPDRLSSVVWIFKFYTCKTLCIFISSIDSRFSLSLPFVLPFLFPIIVAFVKCLFGNKRGKISVGKQWEWCCSCCGPSLCHQGRFLTLDLQRLVICPKLCDYALHWATHIWVCANRCSSKGMHDGRCRKNPMHDGGCRKNPTHASHVDLSRPFQSILSIGLNTLKPTFAFVWTMLLH